MITAVQNKYDFYLITRNLYLRKTEALAWDTNINTQVSIHYCMVIQIFLWKFLLRVRVNVTLIIMSN